jgi:hypothetical protein
MNRRVIWLIATLVTAACDRSTATEGPGTVDNQVSNGAFAATIEGARWTAVDSVVVMRNGPHMTLRAASPSYNVEINLANISAPGVFPLTLPAILGSSANLTTPTGERWSTGSLASQGSVAVTVFTASRIAGTFSFVAHPVPVSGASFVSVTDGTFDVRFVVP